MSFNPKAAIFSYCRKHNLDNPYYLTNPAVVLPGKQFSITLKVGKQTFSLPNLFVSKRIAENQIADEACRALNIETVSSATATPKQFRIAPDNSATEPSSKKVKPNETVESYSASSLDEMLNYLNDEQLAGLFKTILHFVAQNEGDPNIYPKYSVKTIEDRQINYFTCVVDYKGLKFEALGLMTSIKQAESSAAEVCLRSLGHLPAVKSDDDYSIQPYRGGYSGKFPRGLTNGYLKYLSNILEELNISKPQIEVKNSQSGSIGIVSVEGKVFQSLEAQDSIEIAKLKAIKEVFTYLGFTEISKLMTLTKGIQLKTHLKKCNFIAKDGPFFCCPSRQRGWIYDSYIKIMNIKEKYDEKILLEYIETSDEKLKHDYCKTLMSQEPSFCNQPLRSITNLSVAEVIDKEVVIVGNNLFSIQMICKNMQIFCKNRNKNVDILPGHRIANLVSTFEVSFPSLEIYLRAESCNDVFFPIQPLPVPTSCGAVVMMQDHETESGVHVLLCREAVHRPFIEVANIIKEYLNKLILDQPCRLDTSKISENIRSWQYKEVHALSLMTLDSIFELFSNLWNYDERFNEIFFKELPEDLKNLKNICQLEVKHRISQNNIGDKDDKTSWEIPKSSFTHHFLSTGPFLESSILCVSRLVKEKTGILIKLSDWDETRYIDEPLIHTGTSHRGDVRRYYIWSKTKPFNNSDFHSYFPQELTEEDMTNPEEQETNTVNIEKKNLHKSEDDHFKAKTMEMKWFTIQEAQAICPEFQNLCWKKLFKDSHEKLITPM